jgi:putative transposase
MPIMARIARLVVPGAPHHVTQRGNRREPTFFGDDDYRLYRALLAEAAAKAETEIWAYCLMPNHVHVILVPADPDGLRRTFADLHRRYTAHINARNRWTGHLWQGRFGSVAMDEMHLYAAARYVPLNPVRARLTAKAEDWPWSSARAHLAGKDDGVVKVRPLLDRIDDFTAFLTAPFDEDAEYLALRRAETIGRPIGGDDWIKQLERDHGRTLTPRKRGRKPAEQTDAVGGDLFSKLSP